MSEAIVVDSSAFVALPLVSQSRIYLPAPLHRPPSSGPGRSHRFDLEPAPGGARLRHTIAMEARGSALLKWLLLIRPMHDALIEDGFFRAERALGLPAREPRWPAAVRLLRLVARLARRARLGPRAGRPERPAA